uniref:Putative ribonuclease H-like domain-containing protein n=1 Tax=Tanacetum cinerariifolium TaxID=118510 RepID=A0A6L2J5D6_TANCI|nr:putative ribonuclease H-like domain-containing protein [Tanacetum cinerariifolium]
MLAKLSCRGRYEKAKEMPRWKNDPGKLGTAPDFIERSSSRLISDQYSNPTSSMNPNPKGRNRRRSKQQIENSNLEEHSHPIVTMADQRTMAKLLRAPTEGYAEAIVVPPILAEKFELKHSLINMMTTDQFFGLKKDNPHDHIRCFTELHQLDTFYNALNPADQDSLNAAAGGNLLERSTQDVLTIIENKSKVCNSQSKPVVSQVKACDVNSSSEIAKLTHAINQQTSAVIAAMTTMLKQFQATPPPAPVKAVEETYVTCGAAVNYNQGYLGYRPQVWLIKFDHQTSLSNQTNEIKNMMASLLQMNTTSTFGSGSLPSNTVANPNGELKAITTHSGLVIDGPIAPTPSRSINPEEEEHVEETFTDPDLTEYTIKVPHPPVQKYKPPSQREFVMHQRDPRHPNIHYPSRMLKQKQQEKDEVQIQKFWKMFKQLDINIILADALMLMPKYQKTLKSLLSNKEKLQELANTPLNENCSTVILKKLPEKLGDPGKFLISCGFSLPELIPTHMTLELANRAICTTAGIARDVFVPVSKFTFPADFVIVDYESDPRVPLILGRPFLRTARALIDVHGEEMILRDGDERLTLSIRHDTSSYSNQPQKESINLINEFADELPLEYDDNLQFVIESDLKEIEFLLYQDKDSSLKDSIDQKGLVNLADIFVDPIHEMFTDEHALDYSSPSIFDEYDDDFLEVESDAGNVYDDPFDSKDFDPPFYEPLFFKEVPKSKMLLLFSSENEEKVFKPGIHTSEKVHSYFVPELSHQGYKVFKINQIFKSLMKNFLFYYGKDTQILAVPYHHFYPLDQFKYGGISFKSVNSIPFPIQSSICLKHNLPLQPRWKNDSEKLGTAPDFIERVNDSTARERAVVSGNMRRECNPQQKEYKVKRVIDSGCSRHMTGNSVARTPQQNRVAERRNRTLIEAARTMLVNSKLPTTFWAEAVNTACYVLNRALVTKPHKKTPYELIHVRPPLIDFIKLFGCPVTILNTKDNLRKFEGKADEGYFVGYAVVSKAMRVFNKRTRIVEETLNIRFQENVPNVKENRPDWLFDIDSLTISMNYVSVVIGNQTNDTKDSAEDAGKKASEVDAGEASDNSGSPVNTVGPSFVNAASQIPLNPARPSTNDTRIFGNAYDDDVLEEEVDINNVASSYAIPEATKFLKDHSQEQVIRSLETHVQTRHMSKTHEEFRLLSLVHKLRRINHKDFQNCLFACFLSQMEPKKPVQALQDPSWVEAMNKKDERGIVIKNKARLVSQGHTQEEGIDYDEVLTPVARIEAIRLFLDYASFKDFIVYQMDAKSVFLYGKIEDEKELSTEFEKLIHDKFQMSLMGELSFFLGLQVKQKSDGIFISQDKYVAEILKKFDFVTVKSASTPMESNKPLIKDEEAKDVDVHLYRSMIGSLMYLTVSRPDITFTMCACARFQITLKTSHLHAVKIIFRCLKGQPKLGLWYPKDYPFDLEAYSDSNYVGASLDRKSTT